jgi:arylsulfatase A-like enzyme
MPTYSRRELIGLLGSAALAQGRPKPNIIFIMADDHAAHAISAYGSRINRTPNIDRIAAGGVKLTNCFCTNSICTPSRAAILTGQYSHKNGVYTLEEPLDPKRDNVAKQLQKAGYQTR